jgi:hypothetical protein
MAEQEQQEGQPQPDPASSSAETPAPAESKEPANWEQRYKDTEANLTRTKQDLAKEREYREALEQYVDFSKAQGEQPSAETDEGGAKPPAPQKQGPSDAQKLAAVEMRMLTLQFRQDNPDLVPYESKLVVPLVLALRARKPLLGPDALLKEAVAEARELLKDERQKAAKETETKRQEAAGVGGLGSAGSTPPKTEGEPGQTHEQYIAERQAQHAKLSGT